MDKTDFDSLLSEFNRMIVTTKAFLTRVESDISEEKIPRKEDALLFSHIVEELNSQYSSVVSAAREMISTEELPQNGSTVSVYADAVNNSIKKRILSKLQNSENILREFLNVCSPVESYNDALKPYRQEAQELLVEISGLKEIDRPTDIRLSGVDAPELFLRTLKCEDIDSDEGLSLLEAVSEHYSRRVQIGLQGNKYYVEQNIIAPEELRDTTEPADASGQSEHVEKQPEISENGDASTGEPAENEICIGPSLIKSNDDAENVESDAEVPDLGSTSGREPYLYPLKKIKDSNPSASAFKKEILVMPKEIRIILPIMTNLGILTTAQIFKTGVCLDAFEETDSVYHKVVYAITQLSNKGYLAAYILPESKDTAYCLTHYSNVCLQKDSIVNQMKKFWDTSFGNFRICGKNEMDPEPLLDIIRDNEKMLKYLYGIKKEIPEEQYNRIERSLRREGDGYVIAVSKANEMITCRIYNDKQMDDNTNAVLFIECGPDDDFIFDGRIFIYSGNSVSELNDEPNNKGSSAAEDREPPAEIITDDAGKEKGTDENIENKITNENNVKDKTQKIETAGKDATEKTFVSEVKEETRENDDLLHRLLESGSVPGDSEFYELILNILNGDCCHKFTAGSNVTQALLLAKAASFITENKKCQKLYKQLVLATDSPIEERRYSSENLASVFSDPEEMPEAVVLSAYLFGLLVPETAYDYALKSQAERFIHDYDIIFPSLGALKALYVKLNDVREIIPVGFSPVVLSRLGSETESENYIRRLQTQAKDLMSVSAPKTRMKALPVLYNNCFGRSGDLYQCLDFIAKNDINNVEFVNVILEEYCEVRDGLFDLNETKIEDKLNAYWYEVNGQGSAFALEYAARQQAMRQFNNRLKIMKAWSENVGILPGSKYDLARLKSLKSEIVKLATKAFADLKPLKVEFKQIVIWMLNHIIRYLTSSFSETTDMFDELAYTGIISLDEKRIPVLNDAMNAVKYYEPWRNVLRHIVSPIDSFEIAKKEILDGGLESDLFDNLNQLEIIGQITGEDTATSADQLSEAQAAAKLRTTRFEETLELAFTYNRISETEKENLAGIKRQHEAEFYMRKDFGIWRQFLKTLERRITELANVRKNELENMLALRISKPNGANSPILNEAKLLLERDLNFAVTEEYINRFDNGEEDFSEELQFVLRDPDHFSDFISDGVFQPIYNECLKGVSRNYQVIAADYISKHFPAEWTTRLKENSLRFIRNWPIRKGNTLSHQIQSLFTDLGMNIKQAENIVGKKEEMFRLELVPVARSMADYRHPISAFGTQTKSPMNVIVLHGNIPAKQLVDTITEMGLGGLSVVLLDYPINQAVRRQIAEEFHKTTGHNPFILIDQVLAIYLALHQVTERMPIMLKCTLPYTTYQPFIRDGGSIADEMFCGRGRELASIKDPNGACIVYGGRQLGKTALLERAESLCFKPENRAYAIYCNILNCDIEQDMVEKICDEVRKKAGLSLGKCVSIKELCDRFDKLFRTNQMESMLLLLDETDNFLSSISGLDYAPIQPLIDLKRSTKNNFKFVLAGLHNVCRAKNATARNGVFGQLGTPLCVKPLSPTDALHLLSRPLRYLGFQIDRYPHLETILTNTNYYPGILQFFGYMLVETLTNQYSKYYRAVDGNPPYTLQDEQLGAVMNSADLNRSIKDKFRWSLELDQRYFMIARCIAILYYLNEQTANTWLGFSIAEIMEIAGEYPIRCLEHENENEYRNLLDEMVEMGILSKPDSEKNLFRLRRSSFINIIGSDFEAVDADITKNNEEIC